MIQRYLRNRRLRRAQRTRRRTDWSSQAAFEVQALEPRTLLSAGLVWKIAGDANPDAMSDTIVVEPSADDPSMLQLTINGQVIESRAISALRMIKVKAGQGNDSVSVNARGLKAVLMGGPGDDILSGGDGDDVLNGQAGADRLFGQDGNDRLKGGAGIDVLVGGLGIDRFIGGPGKDYFHGEPGVDRVRRSLRDVFVSETSANPLSQLTSDQAFSDWLVNWAVQQWQDLLGQVVDQPWYYGGPGVPQIVLDSAGQARSAEVPPMVAPGTAVFNNFDSGAGAGTGAPNPSTPDAYVEGDYSGTNTQVAGVDEADIVKTDGDYIYTITGNELVIVNTSPADGMQVLSRTTIDGAGQALYLSGDKLTILSNQYSPWYWLDGPPVARVADPAIAVDGLFAPFYYNPKFIVTVLDVSDPSAPTLAEQTTLDGSLVDSRAVDDRIYLVVQNSLPVPQPVIVQTADGGFAYESEADYRQRISEMIDQMGVPSFDTTLADGSHETGTLIDPPNVFAPKFAPQQDMISLVEFDVNDGHSGPDDMSATVGVGGQVFASADSLYLASQTWQPRSDSVVNWGPTTFIHKFDLTAPGLPLVADGSVPGAVNNQFAMDEFDGTFRIATTDSGGSQTSNNLFVLQQQGDALVEVGSINDIALGERIYSVRFMGDRAFMVTFHQVDPLFTIDLSDATHPAIVGTLKIPGYSSYIQALDANTLVTIGRDADPTTGRPKDLQLSLFDVTDLANPVRLDTLSYGDGTSYTYSEAEYDHHAFSLFAEQGILAIPLGVGWYNDGATLSVVQIEDGTLDEIGQVGHDTQVRRSLRVGDTLYSVSTTQIKANVLTDPDTALGELVINDNPYGGGGGIIAL
jgi:uncharacterized secreted protein with C-terminal beta-propeller domain